MEILIRPPKTAVAGPEAEINPTARDLDVLAIKAHGRMAWQKITGYDQRARVETQMGRWKSVIGVLLSQGSGFNKRNPCRQGTIPNAHTKCPRQRLRLIPNPINRDAL
ncbi:putative insertion sequence transposase protein [Stappia aggregata IAM 12614]|uniref:Putative insertion sequence transposase protein n=1 Tax=Roseibium aggregatum (strain ATCC 25650 / DSM 13394 / JCM 20685 / NBRC 16684 / NCIMB 2208 / IAM 12614 / B1) TaxID=384765 RepID=A0P2M0_ROSAI|nr:hypothetical protein [Roseibium aggregatum]EAV40673.1 putative insertion sequence transposase protein [Stappia aggregata IAM 12614] [Roseibium aggregatum IAM 12614]